MTTDLPLTNYRCHCGHWMEHVTETELAEIRKHLSFGD
jgi:hypothetical protein